jgi:hypothetical protein
VAIANVFSASTDSEIASLAAYDWCPKIFRGRVVGLQLTALIVITVTLAALFGIFLRTGISQSLVVPRSAWDGRSLTALAPYSIIPTLIAIGIKLYWASMEGDFRRLQPYVAMTRKPTPYLRGASYFNIPLLWTVGKAALSRDFLLSAVAAGAVLTQVCEYIHEVESFVLMISFQS